MSKIKSIESIANSLNANVITLNETNLKKNKKLNIHGYKCFNRNRIEGNMGGVATCVLESDISNTLKVTEGKEQNEFVITRHMQFVKPVNIINVYGDVESRVSAEVSDEKWNEILHEINKIEARDEAILLLGDINKHLGQLIKGNHEKVSHGRKHIEDLIENGKYVLVNNTGKTINGPFTRYDPSEPKNEDKKSALDLVIVSECLFQYIEKLEIDKNLKWTPCRPVNKKSLRYSDRYSLLLTFKDIPKKQCKVVGHNKPIIWNTNKKGGSEKYSNMTENHEDLDTLAKSPNENPNEISSRITKIMTKLKFGD